MATTKDLSRFLEPNYDGLRKELIKTLGDSPTKIAQSLKNKKITGEVRDPSTCPLANYLDNCGIEAEVNGDILFCNTDYELKMPQAFHKFVKMFDDGKFPELIEDNG